MVQEERLFHDVITIIKNNLFLTTIGTSDMGSFIAQFCKTSFPNGANPVQVADLKAVRTKALLWQMMAMIPYQIA